VKGYPFRCEICNKFIGKKYFKDNEVVEWTPYGSYGDIDEPPVEYAHKHCWDDLSEKTKQLIRNASYSKPFCSGKFV